jgi:hypothetical protein
MHVVLLQHTEPEYYLAQKLVLLSLLVYCARSICGVDSLEQGSSTFQIVRATLTISIMPTGHKAIHDVQVHIIGKKWPERQSDHKPLYNVQTTSGARVCSDFFKTAGGPRQRAPRATR